jgi:universal stress protein E
MKRFRNILFVNEPSSESMSAARRATELARENSAQLTICDANKELPRNVSHLAETLDRARVDNLKDRFEKIDIEGIDISIKLLTGTPFIEIIKEVQRNKYDLVIKTVEEEGGLLRNLFGETDMHLLRKCPCPVWLVKPSDAKTYSRIIAAVDPDPAISEHTRLNELILKLASSLANSEGSELHIVHTWYLEGENTLRSSRTAFTEQEVDDMVAQAEKLHQDWMGQLLKASNLKGVKPSVHLLQGVPGKKIPELVKELDADLLVMGTVARTGIEGFFIGNTAEKILRNVDSSVLTVKPETFICPIKP